MAFWSFISLIFTWTCGACIDLQIGAILDGEESMSAMRMAVEYVNERNILGPSYTLTYLFNNTQIIATTESIQLVCWQVEQGVMAIIGARSSTATKAASPVSTALHIPQITPTATNPQLGLTSNFPYLLRMMAADTMQSRALVDLVETMGWTRMAILTSNTDYGVNGLVQFQSEAAKRDWKIMSVQHFEVTSNASAVDVKANLELIKSIGVRVILLNCLSEFGVEVLKQAADKGMTGPGWAWVVTDGMTASGDTLSEYVPEYMEGLIGTKPSASHGTLWQDVIDRWTALDPKEYPMAGPGTKMSAYSIYIVDAVMTFAYAAGSLYRKSINSMVRAERLSCDAEVHPWKDGDVMLKYLKNAKGPGVSSYIEFNTDASPKNPRFDIVNLRRNGWEQVGYWTPQGRLTLPSADKIRFMGGQSMVADYVSALTGKHIKIVTILEKPFVMMKTDKYDPHNLSTKTDVEGFCIDILEKLAETIGFTYTLYMVPDGKFGTKDPDTYQWNGMVKELVFREADMAVASLTISYPREQDIDYTVPYLDLGMSFVMKVSKTEKPPPFRFLDPFSKEVWMYVVMTTIIVAVYISILNKLSPYDYHGKFMYIDSETQEEERYSSYRYFKKEMLEQTKALGISNSIMFSAGALLQQGYERYPKSMSGRLTSVTWWLGTVIIVATYTANLASLLTASRSQKSINSIEDLGSQTKIKYGTVANSAPYQFFADSNLTLYQDLKTYMETQSTLVDDSKEGLNKVRNEDYAFIWDSAVLDYAVEQIPCNSIHTVGRLFGKIGYGFGLQKSSPYREELSTHILRLRESGFIDQLKVKWYQQRGQCASASNKEDSEAKALEALGGQLSVDHMIGVFYIVYGGCALSLLILVVEWLMAAYDSIDSNDTSKPQSMREALQKQFRNLRDDFLDDWIPQFPAFFPCCKTRPTKEQIQLETAKETLKISSVNELVTLSKVAGALKKVLDSDKSSSLINSLPKVDLPDDIFITNNIAKMKNMVPNGSPRFNGSPRPSLTTPVNFHMNGSPRSSISSIHYLNPVASDPPSPEANVPDLLY